MSAAKKGMKKSTYLIIWTLVIALLCSAVGVVNYEALYWDSALTLYFGEVGVKNVSTVTFDTDDHAQVANLIVAEGAVLLKNEENALPMRGGKISLFGIDNKSGVLQKVLEDEGFTVNPTLAAFYAASSHSSGAGSLSAGNGSETGGWVIDEVPQSEYTADVKASYKDYNDAAVVVLMRTGAEGNDLPYDMSRYGGSADENYLELNKDEKELLAEVHKSFDKVIVLISSANAMQMDFVDKAEYGIDAVLWYARPAGGISSIAKILSGAINPSGRLVDTYVYDNLSSAAMQNFGDYRYVNEDGTLSGYSYVNYAEGIYVGYKYYETRYEDAVLKQGNAGDYDYASTVAYPFGYGLSYTDFEWSDLKVDWDGDLCTASVTVKNTGFTSGKDVVEFYVQSPYIPGGVEKAAVSLAQYVKTSELAPGESQRVSVTFSKQDIASYDAKDAKTYVIDAGDWYVTAAHDAHEAVNNVLAAKGKTTADGMTANGDTAMAAKYTVSERELLSTDAVSGAEVTNQLDDIVYADDTVYLSRSDWSVMDNNGLEYATGVAKGVSNVGNISGDVPTYVISDDLRAKFELKGFAASLNPTDPTDAALYPGKEAYTYGAQNNLKLIDMVGLDYNDPKWDLLLDELKLSEMHQLFNKSGWGSLAVESVGKPKTYEYDAPNGIANFLTDAVIYTYPCATMTAATWSQDVQRIYGNAIGEEAHLIKGNGVTCGHRGLHGGGFLRFDANDADVGPQPFDIGGNAGSQAASAHGHIDGAEIAGMLAEQFERNRALPGDNVGIIEGVDDDIAVAFGQFGGMGAGGIEAVAEKDNLAAQPPHRADLDRRGGGGHDDNGTHAQPGGREGDALGVIARRGANDAALALSGGELAHAVVGATDFEGEDRLEIFAVEEDVGAKACREQLHAIERSLFGHLVDGGGKDAADIVLHDGFLGSWAGGTPMRCVCQQGVRKRRLGRGCERERSPEAVVASE